MLTRGATVLARGRAIASKAVKSSVPYDAVIVGGGHNGLVASAYMAKAGMKVCVLERRHVVGGAAITEELYPGWHYSRASYLLSLFRPSIIKDLELERHGLQLFFRNPRSFTPLSDGRSLALGRDMATNVAEISKFSKKDAEAYPRYEKALARMANLVEPLLDAPLPGPHKRPAGDDGTLDTLRRALAQAGSVTTLAQRAAQYPADVAELLALATAPADRTLSKWFESEPLKATLATDAVIGAMLAPSSEGSGYVLLHHAMGGPWSYVKGGMGAVSQALCRSAEEAGVTVCVNSPVAEILVRDNGVTGVLLEDGTRIAAHNVLSNATPDMTFLKLLPEKVLAPEFRRSIEKIDYTSPVTKINVALDRLPQFKGMETKDGMPGPMHRGTIHFVENTEQIEAGFRDGMAGIPSRFPIIEMTIPSSYDPTVAPPGKHVASLFCQYTPYAPRDGPWTDEKRAAFRDSCFRVIEKFCPGFTSSVLHADVLAPPDLERVFGLTGGNIFHGAMSLSQLMWLRPAPGWSGHATPIRGLYMCGSGTHPGGGVMGASGRNAARTVIADHKQK